MAETKKRVSPAHGYFEKVHHFIDGKGKEPGLEEIPRPLRRPHQTQRRRVPMSHAAYALPPEH